MDTHVDLDIHSGELYLFPQKSRTDIYEYLDRDNKGRLLFVSKSSRETLRLRPEQFLEMRFRTSGATAVRVTTSSIVHAESFIYTDPAVFLDENAPGLPVRERRRITSLKKDRRWAKSVQFFTIRYDETPNVSLSERGLAQFIASHADLAEQLGFEKNISASTLRRAIHKCGAPGDRPLHYFLRTETSDKDQPWDPFILKLKAEMIGEFWSRKEPRLADVQDNFYLRLRDKNNELSSLGAERLTPPSKETLRLWIKGAECFELYKLRHGKRAAGRRFRGQQRAIQASRPLEYVMFDHTRVDAWANVTDEDGKVMTQERPWLMLAVDVFSRLILAAVLTYEPPSIYTVVMCLKQLVRPKYFLPLDLRNFKNFDDGWGKPSSIIVDNGWENTGVSFQTMCESAGINVIWAPVRTPEFKTHVEHAFHLLNSIYWHRLPSGIPHKPHVMAQLGLAPRKQADRTIDKMNEGLWYAIRKIAFRVNGGLGMSPARAWKEGIEEYHRPTIDDVSTFDTFLGKVRQCQLTTSGIKFENQRFHEPEVTSKLLNDMLRSEKASSQRRAPHSSGVVHVHVTIDPETCEYIHVWNARTKQNVKLSNVNKRFSEGRSWDEVKACRDFAKKENLAFCTEDEMLDVSRALMSTYKEQAKTEPFREARKISRRYRSGTRLVPGTVVEEIWEDPSPTGIGSTDIPNSLAARERKDARKVVKSARRGGSAASKKAAKKRAAKRKLAAKASTTSPDNKSAHQSPSNENSQNGTWEEVRDPSALLTRLASSL